MPRTPKIRWTKNQKKRLEKDVRRFNAKINRELKKNPQAIEYLPQKKSLSTLRKDIKTAKDLNRFHASVNRIFKPNVLKKVETEKGIKTTKYEVKEVRLQVNRINRERAREREIASVSKEKGTLSTVEQNSLNEKVFNLEKIKRSDWEKYKEGTYKMSMASYTDWRNKRYKQVYIDTLDILGEYGDAVKEYIQGIDEELFHDAQYDDPILNINFISDPLEAQLIAEQIITHWEQYLGNL